MGSSSVSCLIDNTHEKNSGNVSSLSPSQCSSMDSSLPCMILSQQHTSNSSSAYNDSLLRMVSSNTTPNTQCIMSNGVGSSSDMITSLQTPSSCSMSIERNRLDDSCSNSSNSSSVIPLSQPLSSSGVYRNVLKAYSSPSSVNPPHNHHNLMQSSQHNQIESNEHYTSTEYQMPLQLPISHNHIKNQSKSMMHLAHNTVPSSSMMPHHQHGHNHPLLHIHHDRVNTSEMNNNVNLNGTKPSEVLHLRHVGGISTNVNSSSIRNTAGASSSIDIPTIPQSPSCKNLSNGSISSTSSCNGLSSDSLSTTGGTVQNVCKLNSGIDHSSQNSTSRFIVKNEFVGEGDLVNCMNSVISGSSNQSVLQHQSATSLPTNSPSGSQISTTSKSAIPSHHDNVIQHLSHHQTNNVNNLHHNNISHVRHQHHFLGQQHLHHMQQQQHIFSGAELAAAVAVAAANSDPRHHPQLHYGTSLVPAVPGSSDCVTTQKAVAFLAGPRERIHVLGNPVERCPRCQQQGLDSTNWRPHRHIGELKIRYICERHFDDLESNHHFDIPLCPICNQVLYLYDFNSMLGVSNARRLHKYVLKCANRHVLPLLDLFCQTKKSGERCNANFKLQWCYGTMVKRCEAQKNRDHDLWWVRYKNEWKQRRTIIRYKKDFLSHLTDAQRSLLLGLGLEGEPPPDPKSALGPTFDALISFPIGSPNDPKIKKRGMERASIGQIGGGSGNTINVLESYDLNGIKRRFRTSDFTNSVSLPNFSAATNQIAHQRSLNMASNMVRNENTISTPGDTSSTNDPSDNKDNGLRHVIGAVVMPPSSRSSEDQNQMLMYLTQQQVAAESVGLTSVGPYGASGNNNNNNLMNISGSMIITGTPTPPLPSVANGCSSVAVSVVGEVICSPIAGG